MEAKTLRLSELINPTDRQRAFLDAAATSKFVLYGGAAGGGKSYILRWFCLLFAIKCFKIYGVKNVKVGLFSEDYPTLKDRQLSRIKQEFPEHFGKLTRTEAEGLVFKLVPEFGGGMILPRNLDDPSKYNSTEFAAIAVEELTFNQETVFEELRKRLRWPGFPEGFKFPFVAATNPGGIGHAWVKRLWIERDFYPEIKQYENEFVFIPAKADDNPYNPSDYKAWLLTLKDPQMRRAMAEGDWDLFVGQYFAEWRRERHVCEPFSIPEYWNKWAAADWGFAKPACNLWFARSPEGRTYVYNESYLEKVHTPELGREWVRQTGQAYLRYKVLDSSCWDASHGTSDADQFSNVGWTCVKADKRRKNGWSRLRTALAWRNPLTGEEFPPELQVFSNCVNLIRTLPALVYDKHDFEDLDSDGEDHAADALRYGLMPPVIETKLPDELLRPEMREAQDRAEKWVNR